jgi:16S rRNA (cytosine967-C5)-methyltransferase
MTTLGVRAVAAQALAQVAVGGESLRLVLPKASSSLADPRDRALLAAILFDASRWYLRLDVLLDRLLAKPLRKRDPELHCLLIVGLTQIRYLNLPSHAAVAETVNAARELRRTQFAGLVNAILRRYLREREALEIALDADPLTRSSHPRWLVERLQHDWLQQVPEILDGNNTPAPLWLRVNRRRASVADLGKRLRAHGIEATPHPLCVDALLLAQSTDVTRLPGFVEGEFSVQDGAAQLAADLLALQPGQRVLDACAAPGGKTAHICERADVSVLALDREGARLPRMQENLHRLGLIAELRAADAAASADWWDGQPYQRILLDAPCSASGIIRRQPDIKLHRRATDIATLVSEQKRLLDALWPVLEVGGRFLYATCSILQAENEQQIAAFLARTPDARSIPFAMNYSALESWGMATPSGRQNFPGQNDMDGFFYAILEKVA